MPLPSSASIMIRRNDNQGEEHYRAVANQGGPEEFGRWVGNKYYSLQIVQHPLRARMCGFGDKDRRPLAPAAVAKLVITYEDNSLVDIEEVDISFFIVTVDLWTADGKCQANLVLHPTSTERFTPTHPPSKSFKGKTRSTPTLRRAASSGNQTPAEQTSPTLGPSYHQDEQQQPASAASINGHDPFANQAYDRHQEPNANGASHSTPAIQYGHTQSATHSTTWGYNNSPVDRNVTYPQQTYGQQANPESAGNWAPNSTGPEAYREWNPETNYQHVDNNYANIDQNVDSSLRTPSTAAATPDGRIGKAPWSQPNAYNVTPNVEGELGPAYGQSTFPAHSAYTSFPQGTLNSPAPFPATVTVSPLPRHAYTRTLVGPLSANGCRLMDEHRMPGIFFLFQDLSIRTEGTFRLRMRLMNVGASPAPDMGAKNIHNDVSPVLAQAFTEPFTVFSAKRFPGVPDTTPLSIALGNQGQKLPLRNRRGSTTTPKRRRKHDSESEEESE